MLTESMLNQLNQADFNDGTVKSHTGIMIALYPNPAIYKLLLEPLNLATAEPVDQLHLTLAYLGKTADYQIIDCERLAGRLANMAYQHHTVAGKLTGSGRFNSEDQPLVALISGPDLDQLRQEVLYLLRDNSFPVPQRKHGFMPHITLSYDGNERTPDYPRVDLVFDQIHLCWGKQKFSFPFLGDQMAVTYPWAARV